MRLSVNAWRSTLIRLGFKARRRRATRRMHTPRLERLEERLNFSTGMFFVGQTPNFDCPQCGCSCSPVSLSGGNAAITEAGPLSYNSSSDPVVSM